MGNPVEQSEDAPQSNTKIAIPRKSLEKLIRSFLSAKENDWKVDLKLDDGLPKALVLGVHRMMSTVQDDIRKRDEQITSLCHANVRVLFLNEALGLINDITDKSYIDNSVIDQYDQVLDDVMHATTASLAVMMFVDTDASISEFYAKGVEGEARQPSDKYIKLLGLMASKFIETDNKPVHLHSDDPLISAIELPEGHPELVNMLVLPLTMRGTKQVRGVMYLANKRHEQEFDQNDLSVCELILGEISNVYERIMLNRELRKEKEEQERLLKEIQYAQDQLLQSEKMASIGQLAAGVAHEINNPVGYINSNINSMQNYINEIFELIEKYQGIEEFLPDDKKEEIRKIREEADLEFLKDDVVDLVNESIEGVTRVKQIVNDLKNFSRVDEAEWGWTDLHEGIDSTLNIVHNEIKYKAEVEKHYGDIPDVWCIASQVNQVIMNMLVNAAHAIQERGVITITTGVDNGFVFVKIADDGCGIPEDKVNKIFDPFYTSKPVGEGTGLGLSLSFGIIEKHKGTIEVNSEVGKGTEFTILLPLKEQ